MCKKAPRTFRLCFESRCSSQAESPLPHYADGSKSHNDTPGNRLRVLKTLDGFENNEGSGGHQQRDIDQGCQNFSTAVAERILHRCSLSPDTKGDIGYQYGGKITEIVNRVRNQSHAVGQNPTNDLCDGDNKIQTQGHQKTGSAGIFHVYMMMRMAVRMAIYRFIVVRVYLR